MVEVFHIQPKAASVMGPPAATRVVRGLVSLKLAQFKNASTPPKVSFLGQTSLETLANCMKKADIAVHLAIFLQIKTLLQTKLVAPVEGEWWILSGPSAQISP